MNQDDRFWNFAREFFGISNIAQKPKEPEDHTAVTCSGCGIRFLVPTAYLRGQEGKMISCPNSHRIQVKH